MNNKQRVLSEYFLVPNPSIPRYFGHVIHGQPEVYRSTFYQGKEPSQVLFDWNKRLGLIGSSMPSLLEFEMDLAKKVGPMSVMKPLDKRLSDIDSYYDDVKSSARPVAEKAIDACLDEWSAVTANGCRLRDREEVILNSKLSTNSGSPYFTRRRNVAYSTFDIDMDGEEIYYRDSRWSGKLCAVLGWRGQEGGPKPEDVKQRVVWMFPFPLNIVEAQVYQPLIEAFQRYTYVPAWVSNTAVDQRITQLFDSKPDEDLVVCTDFSAFDQHFNPVLQNAAFHVINSCLSWSKESHFWMSKVYPMKYMIPLMYDIGKVRRGTHGMGSGSGGTNFDETMAHRTLQHEVALAHGEHLNVNSMCLGDDGILTYPGIAVDDVVSSYSQHGLEMNLSKQYASTTDCVYLRRWHSKYYRQEGRCVGVYSTCRALGRLMFQERFYDPKYWGPKMVALRQLSILEGVKWHPLREEFAEYCMKGDKYRLGIDIPGFLVNIQGEAEKAQDYMDDFLGYNQSTMEEHSIADWWIVKFLKSKA